jgi:hypothetical protein
LFLVIAFTFASCIQSKMTKFTLVHSDHDHRERDTHIIFDDRKASLEHVVEAVVVNLGVETSEEYPTDAVVQALVSALETSLVEVEMMEESASGTDSVRGAFLDGIETLVLNIGSSIDPIIPFMFVQIAETDSEVTYMFNSDSIKTIAFEPISAMKIEPRPWLTVVAAAVSSTARMQQMYRYSGDGVASSLFQAKYPEMFRDEYRDGSSVLVPVVSMRSVLDSIPAHVATPFAKTDMQGADFEAIASVGRDIRRIGWLHTEVWHHGCKSYEQFENDFCRDWLPHMTRMGYRLLDVGREWNTCSDVIANRHRLADFCRKSVAQYADQTCSRIQECDVLWVRADLPLSAQARPPLGWNEFGMNTSTWFL